MPIIPKPQVGDVSQNALPGPSATPDDFGAVQGQELQEVGQAGIGLGTSLAQTGIQMKDKLDLAATRDAYSQFQDAALDATTNNVLTLKGQDAIAVDPTTGKAPMDQLQSTLQGLKSTYASSLTTPAQQVLFGRLADTSINQASRMARNHIFEQSQAYANDTLTAEKSSEVNAALADPHNLNAINKAEFTIGTNNNALYKGFPATAAAATAAETSKLYQGLAGTIAQQDAGMALAFANQNKAKFDGPTYEAVTSSLANQVAVQGANQTATALSGLPQSAAMAQAATIQDPKVRDLTIAALNAHYTTQTNGVARQAADQGMALVSQIVADPSSANTIIPQNYPPDQRQALIQKATAMQSGPVQTDPDVFTNLVNQAKSDPQAFLRRDMTPYVDQIAPDDWSTIQTIRGEIEKKSAANTGTAAALAPVLQTYNAAIKGVPGLGLVPQSNGTFKDEKGNVLEGQALQDRKDARAQFLGDFMNRVNTELPDRKDRTQTAVQNIANQMTAQRVVNQGWFGNTTAAQGLIDEHPENYPNYDAASPTNTAVPVNRNYPKNLQGLPNVQVFGQGKNMRFFHYNQDQSAADVYDAAGNRVNTWRKN